MRDNNCLLDDDIIIRIHNELCGGYLEGDFDYKGIGTLALRFLLMSTREFSSRHVPGWRCRLRDTLSHIFLRRKDEMRMIGRSKRY